MDCFCEPGVHSLTTWQGQILLIHKRECFERVRCVYLLTTCLSNGCLALLLFHVELYCLIFVEDISHAKLLPVRTEGRSTKLCTACTQLHHNLKRVVMFSRLKFLKLVLLWCPYNFKPMVYADHAVFYSLDTHRKGTRRQYC